ncbi:hypothetical protein [Haloarchaeobius sp. DFWS5]|uniref:hypothetical protein n=1 Tax=Haloarchaeobius sp. DFWS5 TaxID=3446114 RepID=UPI003EB6B85D
MQPTASTDDPTQVALSFLTAMTVSLGIALGYVLAWQHVGVSGFPAGAQVTLSLLGGLTVVQLLRAFLLPDLRRRLAAVGVVPALAAVVSSNAVDPALPLLLVGVAVAALLLHYDLGRQFRA